MKTIVKQVIGIDVGMDSFFVCYKTLDNNNTVKIKATKNFKNTEDGINEFRKWTDTKNKSKDVDILYVMEATGVYHENLCYNLDEHNKKVIVTLPVKMKYFKVTDKTTSKNDKNDSKAIANYGLEKIFSAKDYWVRPLEDFRLIRFLTREHTSLKKRLTALKNKKHALNHAHIKSEDIYKIVNSEIAFIEQQIKDIEHQIKKSVKETTIIAEKINKIEKIKGLGFMSVVTILAETNCFELFTNIKQLTSYAGLDVIENQSGKFTGKTKLSKKGNATLRTCLYMPALSACKYNKTLKKVYERIAEGRKYKKQATVAIMRKLLILTYTIWNKNE
ncbi:MAG: IS110 family transposase, partial [Bacteroidales bacterium]|nr:IS110 family transposase [Bacteroidales bacterium]